MVDFREPALVRVPNAGGNLAPEDVVGRDQLASRLWGVLATRSVLLLAPRRVGKTSLCTLMRSHPAPGFAVCLMDVENCADTADFGRILREQIGKTLEESKVRFLARQTRRAARSVAALVKRVDFGVIAVAIEADDDPNRQLLGALEEIARRAAAIETIIVLIWDELPWFIDKLARRGRAREAADLLDTLRSFRQSDHGASLRMVYTGSVGLHGVIARMRREQGYRGKPVNDMALERVPVLDPQGARELAASLLWSLDRPAARDAALVGHVAARSGGHPYVIQWLVSELQLRAPDTVAVATVDALVDELVGGDLDPLDFEHYLERMGDMEAARGARQVLDLVAHARGRAVSVEQLDNLLPEMDRAAIADVLQVLRRDGYLERDRDGFVFSLELLGRWWANRRGLA